MKVSLKPALQNKSNLVKQAKKVLSGKKQYPNNPYFDPEALKRAGRKPYVARKAPNWCDIPESGYVNRTIARTRCYYPEDIEKMKSMSESEAILYKRTLDKQKKYYYDETPGLLKELEEFLHSCGKTLDDVLVKD